MSYTLHLFAVDAEEFSIQCQNHADAIIQAVADRVTSEGKLTSAEIAQRLTICRQLLSMECPKVCDPDYFWVVCWIGDTVLERIDLVDFVQVDHFEYLEATGILPTVANSPPFLPEMKGEAPNAVGYVPASSLEETIEVLESLPDPADDSARVAQVHFIEVLESLADDDTDLLMVLTG